MRQARKSRQQAKRRVAENFWQNQLARQAVVNICADYPRSEGGGQWQIFSPDWPGQFRQLVEDAVRRLGCQPADVVLAALTIVLRRYSAQEDLTVGWHQLPLTVCLDGKQPVDRLVAAVAEQRRQMDGYAADAPSGSGRLVTGVTEVGRCDDSPVEIELVAERDDFAGYWRYRSDLFRPDTIRRWHGHFCRVVGTLAAGQPELAGEVEITTEDERHEVAELFNATALAVDEGATVVSLFLDRVKADPDRIALVSGPQRYSYRQLAGEVERLAGWLADQGLTREQPVAVMVERSAEVVIAALAVMWAGGVYVPVDPTYPPARIQHILTDSQTRIILTQTGLKDRIGGFDGMIADLAGIRQWADGDRPVPVRSRPEGLAYIIYTSGSTGKPKGVMIEHRNLVNYSFWMRDYLQLTADDKTTAYASFGFDASIGELFPILTVGGELHIIPAELRLEVEKLNRYLLDNGITFVDFPTQFCEHFLDAAENNSLRYLVTGGDKLRVFRPRPYRLVNEYGPTEFTVTATAFIVDRPYDNIPIGRPVANSKAYIVDVDGRLAPVGVPGELCLSGRQIARGYLNRPDLTAEKFVANPFSSQPGYERMYRTGDLCRWLPDGNIEYWGRIDTQVKIRGFRIELGEIEQKILEYPGVREAVVTACDADGDKYLCAYVVGEGIATDQLRDFLAVDLPAYMIPAAFVEMDRLPLNPSGKVDKRALPAPRLTPAATEYSAPVGEREQALARIWQEVLKIERIGREDNFFSLGGNSLKLTILAAQLRKQLGIQLPVAELFRLQTIAQLAAFIGDRAGTGDGGPVVEHIADSDFYPASAVQERMFFLNQLEGEKSTTYNIPMVIELNGQLDYGRLNEAVDQLWWRHEALRTYFRVRDNRVVQMVAGDLTMPKQWLEVLPSELDRTIAGLIRPFDLEQPALCRSCLIKVNDRRHVFFFDAHHIIFDGISYDIFIAELTALLQGQTLPGLRFQYRDYACWHNRLRGSSQLRRQEEYWLGRFADEVPVLNLVTDHPRPAQKSYRGGFFTVPVEGKVADRLRELARSNDCTLYVVLLAAYSTLLAKYTGQEDIVIGSPVSGRSQAEFNDVIGMFVNTVPLRTRPEGNKRFDQFLSEIRQLSLEAIDNQDYPLDQLIDRLNLARDMSRSPLFDVVFALRQGSEVQQVGDQLTLQAVEMGEGNTAKFDLTFYVVETGGGLAIEYEYAADLFDDSTVRRMSRHFHNLLAAIARNSNLKLWEYSLFDREEWQLVTERFNDTAMPLPPATVQQLVTEQAARTPEALALWCNGQQYSYREMDEISARMAAWLCEQGVGRGDVVAVMLQRSAEMVIAALASLRAGAAYLPVDITYPQARIEYMLEDSRAKILLSEQGLRGRAGSFAGVWQDVHCPDFYTGPVPAVDGGNQDNHDLAVILYTSGSTGQPKGVMIEHLNIVSMCLSEIRANEITAADRMGFYASFGFDAALWSMFAPLMVGAPVYVLTDDVRFSLSDINDYFNQHGITVTLFTTQLCEQFIEHTDNRSLRLIATGGEKFRNYRLTPYTVVNIYGPTEYTVLTTRFPIDKNYENIPIGRPVANTAIYMMDRYRQVMPVGVPGELCVAGAQLSRGYLNRPDLTGEKYLDNPFSRTQFDGRLYRTGDLARWLPDGNIEFLGRIDQQVKIRGFRIELGEIEQKMLEHPQISDAVVVVRDEPGGRTLCGYFVASRTIGGDELKRFIGVDLPDYMVPAHLIQLDQLPVNVNGKVDRRRLPEPGPSAGPAQEYVAPRSELEFTLVDIWKEVLGVGTIGVHDNFFSLGGNSLKLTVIAAKIKNQLSIKVPVSDMFRLQTVEQLAQFIARQRQAASSGEVPVAHTPAAEYYPASAVQERLFTIDRMAGGNSTNYNIPFMFELRGEVDQKALSSAVDQIIARHEALRTSFAVIDGRVVQKVSDKVRYKKTLREVDEAEVPAVFARFVRPFDLTKPPLFRLELLKISSTRYVLMFDVHHIIFDGTSYQLFIDELKALLNGYELEPVRYQYRDYAAWQAALAAVGALVEQEKFWLDQFADEVPVLNMVTDFVRPGQKSYRGGMFKFDLDAGLSRQLRELAVAHNCTLYTLMLAAFSLLLSRYSGQEDIVIGTPVSGRSRDEFSDVIGMFVNTLPLRLRPAGDKTIAGYLAEVRDLSLKAIDCQDYQLDQLIDRLKITRDSSRNPLFDVVFALREGGGVQAINDHLLLREFDFAAGNTAKMDLTLYVVDGGDQLAVEYEYACDLFREETVRRLARYYRNLLASLASQPQARLHQLSLLDQEEFNRVVREFNGRRLPLPEGQPWHELFRAQARRSGYDTALVYKDRKYSYRQLDEASDRLAAALRQQGIGREEVVAIILDRSAEMVMAAIAVMKAGAAYLPVDVSYPRARIEYMLSDSRAKAIISQAGHRQLAGEFSGPWFDCYDQRWYAGEVPALPNISTDRDLAVILYTSGSTGQPKGVMIEHLNIVNMCLSENQDNRLSAADVVGSYASFGFDAAMWSNFAPLLAGAAVHVIPDEIRYSLADLNRYFEQHNVTVSFMTTQLCEQFMELIDNKSLRILATGGEKFRHYRPTPYTVVNGYGPTEYTVYTTRFIVDKPYENVPIGRPLANTSVFMLDKHGQLMPTGVPGELCVAGPQLSRGYLNRPELTADKYIANPYAAGEHDRRLYRTGDLARWLPDGNIEYLGRIDMQVKIRGFRIELGEIEQKILEFPGVTDAAVVDRDDPAGGKYLCGYLVAGQPINAAELKTFLAGELPDYMVPPHIIQLEQLPVNVNGKVDRKRLPDPDLSQVGAAGEFAPPVTDSQKKIAAVWQEVLGVGEIGINDNFFAIGGSSIKAISVVTKLQREFAITINDLFSHQTIAQLAENVKPCRGSLIDRLAAIKQRGEISAGPASQQRRVKAARARYLKKIAEYDDRDYRRQKYYKTVLLSGATGFLGAYLLHQLLTDKRRRVIAVVRGNDRATAESRLRSKLNFYFGTDYWPSVQSRLEVVCADLEQEKLGLDSGRFRELAGRINAIYHAAANVRHFGPYDEFYAANVKATVELLQLARAGKNVDFHHISTMSVANGQVAGKDLVCFDEFTGYIGQDSDNVYIRTKQLAEAEVLDARRQGLNTSIYRVGNIAYHHQTGRYQENFTDNAFFSRINAYVNIGAITPGLEVVDMTYVDKLAEAIVRLSTTAALANEIYHLFNYRMVDMAGVLAGSGAGLAVDSLPLPQFIDYLVARLDKEGFRQHIENILAHSGWLDDDRSAATHYEIFVDKTERVLAQIGFTWPEFALDKFMPLIRAALAGRVAALAKSTLFAGADEEALLTVAGRARLQTFEPGEDLVWQGEENDKFYVIVSGVAEVFAAARGGWLGTIGIAKAGDFVGQEALVGGRLSSLTVEAIRRPLVVLQFPAAELADRLLADRRLTMNLLRSLDRRIHNLERLFVHIS